MTMTMTRRQKAIRGYIVRFIGQHGYGPTLREIGAACDVSNISVVSYNVRRLAEMGHVALTDGISRGITLPAAYRLAGQAASDDVVDEWDDMPRPTYQRIGGGFALFRPQGAGDRETFLTTGRRLFLHPKASVAPAHPSPGCGASGERFISLHRGRWQVQVRRAWVGSAATLPDAVAIRDAYLASRTAEPPAVVTSPTSLTSVPRNEDKVPLGIHENWGAAIRRRRREQRAVAS